MCRHHLDIGVHEIRKAKMGLDWVGENPGNFQAFPGFTSADHLSQSMVNLQSHTRYAQYCMN